MPNKISMTIVGRVSKIYWLVLLFFLVTGVASGQAFSAMSYNLRYASPNDGDDRWEFRKASVGQLIRHYQPTFLGIQEGLEHQLLDLDEQLPPYRRIGVGRSDGKTGGEFAAIYYDADRFSPERQATTWLSASRDTASVGWDAAMERIATYGVFRENSSGKRIFVLNAHYDHIGKIARENSSRLILQIIKKENPEGYPVIVMGDLNSPPQTPPISLLDQKLDDGASLAPEGLYGPTGTFSGFKLDAPLDNRIDYIFTLNLEVKQYQHIDDRRPNGRWVSDHLPVLAQLSWK
jgi:endonuclease/exonuclease/phosphatase family metal-dependent hydrolase